MFTVDYVKALAPIVAVGIGFVVGYSCASNKCTIQKQEQTIQQEQANNENLQATIFIDNKIKDEVYHVAEDLYLSLSDIDNEFSVITSTPIINSHTGLSINSTGEDSKELSDTTKATTRVSEDEARHFKDNAEKFQRLYSLELEKAKKCDIAIVKLNNLIDFYTKVYTTYSD